MQPLLDRALTDEGAALLESSRTKCIGDVIFKAPFVHTSEYTVDGRSLGEWIHEYPTALDILRDQRIGRHTPEVPVLVTAAPHDDTVPYGQARRLAEDWCAAGADVTFRTTHMPALAPGWTLPDHFGPLIHDTMLVDEVTPWLLSTLEGGGTGCTLD